MTALSEKTLTGVWTGVFDYAGGWGEATPFNAIVTETGGIFTGEVVEPNTIAADALHEIFASIVGARIGLDVSFVKTYESLVGVDHTIEYHGVCDADLRRIRGDWTIDGGRNGRGPFIMNRSNSGAEEEAETTFELATLLGSPSDNSGKTG